MGEAKHEKDCTEPNQWAVEEVKRDEDRPNGRWVFLAPAGAYQPADEYWPEPGDVLTAVEPG